MSDKIWSIVLVEDHKAVRRQVLDFLHGLEFDFGTLEVQALDDFDKALALLGERKVDLLILDVMGDQGQNKTAGLRVMESWRRTGFAPVIFYTALPESVDEHKAPLIKIVAKDSGLEQLSGAIEELFRLKIPQTHRAIVRHFDAALRDYMWGFVSDNWDKLAGLVDQPDFVRLLLRRLAAQFSRDGVDSVVASLYPDAVAGGGTSEVVHPTEYYIKPPIGLHPQLGDIRKIEDQLVVVVWPSCDLVVRGDGCKVERALCAKLLPLKEFKEYKDWVSNNSNSNRKALESLMRNNKQGGQAERYHFLPAAWDIPSGLIDFQDLLHVEVGPLRQAECLATVASPFAEAVGARFVRYLGRLGTPDLDIEAVLKGL